MPDPLAEVRKLQEAVKRKASELGLNVEIFSLVPSPQKDRLQVMFKILPDAVVTAEEKEQDKFDDQFEAIMGAELAPENPEAPEVTPEEVTGKSKLEEWFD